ncbi:cation diffusion facilitator family transporter [Candidatus Saccharibacteria bacterium]|nr:cation diffusion facilitator family transporter [Candidatus Saccharibacteria bacterium]
MKNPRSQIIIKSGYLFILVNFLLAIFNIIVGVISGSLAIISDAAHSLIDSISGLLIIVSEKLSSRQKLTAYRIKIERTTTIIIALIIIITGLHIIVEAFEELFAPEEVVYSVPTFIVLIASIATKYLLAIYLKKQGRIFKSSVLSASGAETMNDTLISIAVLVSALIYLIWQVNLEAYISIIISLIIIKVGLEFIFPHLSHHHHHHLESNPDHDHCQKAH